MQSKKVLLSLLALTFASAAIPARANETVAYTYDELGRLVRVTTGGTAVTSGQTVDTSFDPSGNRVTRVINGTSVPVISITNSPSANEGGSLVFTIAASPAPPVPISVNFATTNNTAFATVNYAANSGTVTLTASQPSQTVTISTINDLVSTPNLTVSLNLSTPTSGAALGIASGVGTIVNINPAATISITNTPSVVEGGTLTFTVVASPAPSSPITVSYATANDSATAPTNYVTQSGTITLTPAQPSQTITVSTLNDGLRTGDMAMSLSLSAPTGGATLGTASALGTIFNRSPVVVVTPLNSYTLIVIP